MTPPVLRTAAPGGAVADPDAAPGAIAVTAKFVPVTLMQFLTHPRITVDGYLVAGAWGRNVVEVPAGAHTVGVSAPSPWGQHGHAETTVIVASQQTVDLEYCCPVTAWTPGSLGAPPQRYNGVPLLIALVVGPVALLLCCGLLIWLIDVIPT